VAGKNFKKLTRSAWAMWCATGKFSNFENFAADSKMFENFPAYLNFFLKNPADFKNLAGILPIAHHLYIPVAHWVVRYG
jgi:hypothetical protein